MSWGFWIGLLIGISITYSLFRANFYIQIARGNIILNRSLSKAETLIVGNVKKVREQYEEKEEN